MYRVLFLLLIDILMASGFCFCQPNELRGTVEGSVVDELNMSVAGEVHLLELTAFDGYPRFVSRCIQEVDPGGRYQCLDVPPGQYLVLFVPEQPTQTATDQEAHLSDGTPWHLITYYPGVSVAEEAELIRVIPEQTLTANLSPARVPVQLVHGSISAKPPNAFIDIVGHAFGMDIPINVPVTYKASDGTFSVPAIVRGETTIEAQWDSREGRRTATASVVVGSGDAVIQLHENPPININGSISRAYNTDLAASGSQQGKVVLALKCSTLSMTRVHRMDISGKDTFSFTRLPPGRCSLQIEGSPSVYINTMNRGRETLSNDNFLLPADVGTARYALELATSYGAVSGIVSCDGGCGEDAGVVLKRKSSGESFVAHLSPDGRFSANMIPAGEYDVYAWKQLSMVPYRSLQFLQKHDREAQRISIVQHQSSEITIALSQM